MRTIDDDHAWLRKSARVDTDTNVDFLVIFLIRKAFGVHI